MLRSKKNKLQATAFQDIDPAMANALAVGASSVAVNVATGDVSTTVRTAYDNYITVSSSPNTSVSTWGTTGSGSVTYATDPTTPSIKEEERQERLAELASSLENLIADFLPDSDKDVPTKIAKSVVDHIFNEGNVAPLLIDAKGYRESESQLIKNFQNMTMDEYAKIRPKLMKGVG